MVHGGGHHGGGGGSGGGWGGGGGWSGGHHNRGFHHHRREGNDFVIINNNPGWGHSYQRGGGGGYHGRSREEEECDECCKECCCKCCVALCCGAAITESGSLAQSGRCHPMACYVFLSLVVFMICMATSHVNESWTMNPHETRRVDVGGLNHEILIKTVSGDPEALFTYNIRGHCPPLTGPPTTLSETHELHLASQDYQYDYYFLNKGSHISVTFSQKQGATNVYLLRGLHSLEKAEDDDTDDSFSSESILQKYAAKGTNQTLHYQTRKSKTYVVVYDNASWQQGEATVNVTATLTQYSLEGKAPACSHTSDCVLDKDDDYCVLVSAGDAEVEVKIGARRSYGWIGFFSVLPMLLGIVTYRSKKRREEEAQQQPPYPPSTAPQPYEAVPASAPPEPLIEAEIMPSAPIAEDLPIPVAVPVEKY